MHQRRADDAGRHQPEALHQPRRIHVPAAHADVLRGQAVGHRGRLAAGDGEAERRHALLQASPVGHAVNGHAGNAVGGVEQRGGQHALVLGDLMHRRPERHGTDDALLGTPTLARYPRPMSSR